MAEFVQGNLEDMLTEVEQMARVNLFSTAETRSLLKKRKAYEYKLQRKTKQKADFLLYIQYEINVLALIRKRREKTGYQFKKMDIDVAIISRIHRLFRMACHRFQEDKKLWLSHLEFAKSREEKATVSKVYTRMLQVHSRTPGMWISAAKWEMEDNASMENARSLLQRGLRFNSESQKLWIEYFRMELLNVDKLRKRREVLGLAHLDVDDPDVADIVVEGKLAEVVFQQAVAEVPNDVDFILAFLPVLRPFPFARSISGVVFDHLKEKHGDSEKTWDALAKRHLDNACQQVDGQENDRLEVDAEELCLSVYEDAVSRIPTDLMWTFYLQTCLDLLESSRSQHDLIQKFACLAGVGIGSKSALKKADETLRLQSVFRIFKRAEDADHVTEEMYRKWVCVLQKTGQTAEIDRVCEEATRRYRKSASLWYQHLSHVMRMGRPDVEGVVHQALEAMEEKESLSLWKLGLEYFLLHDLDKAEALLENGVTRTAVVAAPLKVLYLDLSSQKDSIKKTRKLYSRLSVSQPLSVDFFRKYISIEKAQPELKMKTIRQGYEDALREYGNSHSELWLEFIQEEHTLPGGQPEKAGDLHWRALKALDAETSERFITQYTLLQTGHLEQS